MATYKDRIKESTNVLGVDPAPLQGVQLGFKAFSTLGDGASVYYTIQGRGTGEFEVGLGTYNLGANTITRGGVVSSSNSDNLVFFSAGTKDIFLTYPANQIPTAMDSATAQAGTSTTPQTVSASVLQAGVTANAQLALKADTTALTAGLATKADAIKTGSNGFMLNSQTVTQSYNMPVGYNALAVGPITLAPGVAFNLPAGSKSIIL